MTEIVAGTTDGDARRDAERQALKRIWAPPSGWRIISAVNNTIVGYFYIGAAFLFFLLAGILGLLLRTQLAVPSNTFLRPETYDQIFTMHGTVMMFVFAVPAVEAIGILLLPQMLGARNLRSRASARSRSGRISSAASCSFALYSSIWRRRAAGSCIRRSQAFAIRRASARTSGSSASASSKSRPSPGPLRSSSECCARARPA
jgi:hypothetical protein